MAKAGAYPYPIQAKDFATDKWKRLKALGGFKSVKEEK